MPYLELCIIIIIIIIIIIMIRISKGTIILVDKVKTSVSANVQSCWTKITDLYVNLVSAGNNAVYCNYSYRLHIPQK